MNRKRTKVSKIPRQYQIDAQEMALQRNVILCLPTGSGKTFIAIMVLNKYTECLKLPIGQGGKRAFFLVPTKVLVNQQADAIAADTPFKVGRFSGESKDTFGAHIDNWQKPYWDQVFDRYQVLVMTRRIFLDVLSSAYISTSSIATIIFDEAHRGAPNSKCEVTNDEYVSIMDTLKLKNYSDIRIVGLTASLINNRWVGDDKMERMISTIEDTFDSTVFFPECNSGTCPEEIIWCFKEPQGWDSIDCSSIPDALKRLAAKIPKKGTNNGNDEDDESVPISILLENAAIPITSKQMRNTFETLADISFKFGPWSLLQGLIFVLKSFDSVHEQLGHLKSSFIEIIELVIQTLKGLQEAVRIKLDKYEKGKDILAGVSHKMLRLLQLLYEFNSKPNDNAVSAIIFVERRLDALVLSKWLNAVGESIPEYSFIRSAFTIGSATMAPFPFNSCLRSRQRNIIEDFKSRKLNILVSTSVLEEGLDINHCNLIVRYDEAKTFRAYVQSKGRARSREAYFVFFAPETSQAETKKNINMFHHTETRLPHYRKQTQRVARLNDNVYLNTTSGAILSLNEAKNRVIFYCDHLPADGYTIKSPKIKTEEIETRNEIQSKVYRCDLNLPKISPLHKMTISSIKCTSEQEAETFAYYEAVKILWAYGELDDSFRPLDKKTLLNRLLEKYKLKTDRTELKDWEKECDAIKKAHYEKNKNSNKKKLDIELPPKPGTNKMRRYYPIIYSKVLTGYESRDSPCWLYKLTLTVVTNGQSTHFGALGLVTFNVLPLNLLEDKLFIFSTKNRLKVSVELLRNFVLKEHELDDIRKFQEFIYSGCLKIGLDNDRVTSKIFFTNAVAPYHLLFTFLTEENEIDYSLVKQTYKRRPIVPADYSTLAGALITKNYGPNRTGLFLVEKVEYGLSPRSPFPVDNSEYDTYEDYYRRRYGIPKLNEDQPLLVCYASPTKVYFPAQPDKPTKKSKRELKRFYLVPEICNFEYFSGYCVNLVYTIPAITSTLNQCLIADEIRKRFCNEIGYGQAEIPLDVKRTWERKRFTNFVPLRVATTTMTHSSKPTDLSYVTCNRYQEPIEESISASSLSLDVAPAQPTDVSADDGADYDTDCSCEEESDNLEEDEPINPEIDSFMEENETRRTLAEPRIYSVTQATIFSEKPSPSIKAISWCDRDIKIASDDLERRLTDHSPKITKKPEEQEIQTIAPESYHLNEFTLENSLIRESNSIYQNHSSTCKYGLPIEIIIEALTTKKANAFTNLERLEIIGDSFLKYIVSVFLFLKLHDLNEARTTWLKMHLISNFNLLHYGRSTGLAQLINDKNFLPRRNWLPPFYSSNHREFTEQEMTDKSIADMVEAMIGAHLTCLGEDATIGFLRWLGMPLTSLNVDGDEMETDCAWLPLYNDVLPVENQDEVDKIWRCSNLSILEGILGYEFKRKDLLIEALTHPSWCRSRLNSYQRLEFLGDAILDYLITAYVFDHPNFQHLKPGELTHIRQALVNNDYFATIALVNNFNKFMFHASPTLHTAIAEFRAQLTSNDLLGGNKIKLGSFLLENLENLDNDILTEAPKALGDIFESIAGAIYLDSDNSLAAVWQVYSRFLGNELEFFCANVPKSPVIRLFETFPDSKFIIERSNNSKNQRKRLNLVVDGWSFTVNEDELAKEGMTKRKERLSLVLSALNTLVKDKPASTSPNLN